MTSSTASCWWLRTLSGNGWALIRQEIGAPEGTGRIVMKMNALVDDRMIDLLYEASQAGVDI